MSEPTSVRGVFAWLIGHPWQALFRRWNYKSALFSSLIRASLFFAVNLRAGTDAAAAAMLTEWSFRLCTSGFYGALTQAFRRAEPRWAATACVLVLLPAVSHSFELGIHWLRGTVELAASIAASVALTVVSTGFNIFAMRRGTLIVGEAGRTILDDVRALPRLIVLFVTTLARTCVRACL
jgi:hypothetical protein